MSQISGVEGFFLDVWRKECLGFVTRFAEHPTIIRLNDWCREVIRT